MKTNTPIAVLSLLCSVLTNAALGQDQNGTPIVKTNVGQTKGAGQGTGQATGPQQGAGHGIVVTDQGGVSNAGTQPVFSAQTVIAPGMYYVGDMSSKHEEFGLLVEQDSNNPDYIFAIMTPLDVLQRDGFSGRGYFYQGRAIKDGSKVMLTAVGIDLSGNARIESEFNDKAPVIEVSLLPGKANKFPFAMIGRNGALGGRVLRMRGAERERPSLQNKPAQGFFVAATQKGVQAAVFGDEVTLTAGSQTDGTYKLWALNGEFGKFSALISSDLNPMSETDVTPEDIKKIVTFVRQPKRDVMIVAQPSYEFGQYDLRAYRLAEKSLIERWFPGRTTPNTDNGGGI